MVGRKKKVYEDEYGDEGLQQSKLSFSIENDDHNNLTSSWCCCHT